MATSNVVVPLKPQAVSTSTATALATGTIRSYNASAGALAPVLPSLANVVDDDYLIVEKDSLDTTLNAVTVTCAGSDTTANGSTSIALTVKGQRVELQAATISGTRVWKTIHHTIPKDGLDVLYKAPAATVVGASGSAQTLTAAAMGSAIYDLTASAASCALTLTAAAAGVLTTLTVFLRQDGTGGRKWVFPSTVRWPNGQYPVLSVIANRYDVVTLVSVDGGTTWTGALASTNTAVVQAPAAPVLTATAGTNQVVLTWPVPNPGGAALTGYILERRTGTGSWSTIATPAASATTYSDSSLTAGIQLGYRLTATNDAGLTATSTEATATPTAPSGSRPASAPTGTQPARWYRADHAAASSGTVTSWPDEMGSATPATPGKAAPTLVTGGINGLPVLRFAASAGGTPSSNANGTGQNMVTDFPATPESITVLAVVKPTAIGSAGYAVGPVKAGELTAAAVSNNGLTGGFGLQIPTDSTGNFEIDRAFAALLLKSNTGLAAGTAAVVAASVDSNANAHATKAVVNGGTVATATPAAYTATTGLLLAFGGSNNGQANTFYTGDIAEVIVFASALSESERHAWTQYLGTTYGITIGAN